MEDLVCNFICNSLITFYALTATSVYQDYHYLVSYCGHLESVLHCLQ